MGALTAQEDISDAARFNPEDASCVVLVTARPGRFVSLASFLFYGAATHATPPAAVASSLNGLMSTSFVLDPGKPWRVR